MIGFAMPDAIRVLAEARILVQRAARRLAELRELTIVSDRQDQLAVRRIEHLVRHDVGVRVAYALRHAAGDQVIHAHVRDHRHLRVEQRHVDVLTCAGARAME